MFRRRNLLALIAGAVDDRSARGIAAAVSRLVTAGSLPAGTRLPTVRDVARELGISPTTVSEAWRSLARGRCDPDPRPVRHVRRRARPAAAAPAVRPDGRAAGALPRDLSTGVPDHDLLPDLDRRAAAGSATPG